MFTHSVLFTIQLFSVAVLLQLHVKKWFRRKE